MPPPAAAAEIMLPVGPHLPEVFGDVAHDFPGTVAKPCISNVVTGILIGNRLFYFFGRIQLELAGPQGLCNPFHIMEAGKLAFCRF